MEIINQDYKKTRLGIVPKNWELVNLKEILSKPIQNGYSPICPEKENGNWILGLGALTLNKMDFTEKKPAPLNDVKVKKFLLKKGDFLISRANTPERVGYSGVVRNDFSNCAYPDLMMRFRIDESKLDSRFLEFFLKSSYVMKYLKTSAAGSSSTMVKINKTTVENILILKPKLKEQKKISDILITWENMISKQKELISEKRNLKKGLVQRLLSSKLRFNEFKDDWRQITLSEILKERKDYSQKGLAFEHLSLTQKGVVPKSKRYERDFLVKDSNKKYKLTYINDICYNPANLKFGVICKNTYGTGIFSPIYITYEVNVVANADFIGHYLTWSDFIGRVRRFEEGTVYERMAVSSKDFLSYKIKIPSIKEEQKIAKLLSQADREVELLEGELIEVEEQKKGLMQKLLTGEVRVEI